MKRSNHLHQLIKSLSKSEKRSFKLYAQRNSSGERSNYIELFDAIEKMEEYDDKLLPQKLKTKKLVDNLSTVKVQLYNLILKSLRNNNTNDKVIFEIRKNMDYIDILFEKGLYNQCKKILEKAKQLAYKVDSYIALDSLSIYEYEIAIKEASYQDIEHYVNETYPSVRKARKTNEDLAEYEYLLARIKLLVLKSNRTGASIDKAKFEELVDHHLLRTPPREQDHKCQIDYHNIWGTYYQTMGDRDKAYYHRKVVLDLLEQRPDEVNEFPKVWIYHARLLLLTLGRFKMYEQFGEEQDRIKAFIDQLSDTKKTHHLNSEIYITIYNTRLDLKIDQGKFSESAADAKVAEQTIKKYSNQIDTNSKAVLYYNFNYAYFGNGEHNKALVWINKLMDQKLGNIRMDLQCFVRIMNVINHYELGNYEIISSLIRSTNRFLIKVERKFELETWFLKFASRYLQEEFKPQFKEDFEHELLVLEEITKNPHEKKSLEYFDLISWLKTKIEGTTLEEVMSKKEENVKLSSGIM